MKNALKAFYVVVLAMVSAAAQAQAVMPFENPVTVTASPGLVTAPAVGCPGLDGLLCQQVGISGLQSAQSPIWIDMSAPSPIDRIFQLRLSFASTAAGNVELRFSPSALSITYKLTDLDSSSVFKTGDFGGWLVFAAPQGSANVRAEIDWSFVPGHYLSQGPAGCAAFSCMAPGADQLLVSDVMLTAVPVDELMVAPMLLAGLAGIALVQRRRKAQSSPN